ncbi:hypothetical protein GC170_16845 [bacterium]|nr:hypothetical protein [bacterium]
MSCRFIRAIFLTAAFAFVVQHHAQAQAPGDAPPGLPPVIESLGAGDPPDLPPSSSPSAPSFDNVTAPYLQKPAEMPAQGRSGSVLDTLDNLPPVGSESQPPRLPSLPDDLPPDSPESAPSTSVEQPRVVRFGDVRTESAARQQFPELRNKPASPSRSSSDLARSSNRPEEPEAKSRGFLSRLMPWRRQPPAEPPLVVSSRNDDDRSYRSNMPLDSSVPSARNRTIADRIDQELQKKADRAARLAVGTKTNELNVQVIDEEIYIRARPMWFWQRRQITDELRNLQGFEPKRLHVTVY